MATLLKKIGRGLLYLIIGPLFLLAVCFVGVIGIFGLIYLFFKSIYLFFTGRSLYDDLPEDKLAKAIKDGKNKPNKEQVIIQDIQESKPLVEHNNNDITIEEAVFGHPIIQTISQEELEKENEVEEKPIIVNETIEEPSIEPIKEENNTHIVDIIPEKVIEEDVEIKQENIKPYKETTKVIIEEEEEEDSGVTISFGGSDDD